MCTQEGVEKMKKTMYSLTLSDDVMREVDMMAHMRGTNRSSLVNQILAEYVKVRTPEQRVNDIFNEIAGLMAATQLVPQVTAGAPSMELRSCLEFKYRPTVRYEVELSQPRGGVIGSLSVVYRTQSDELLSRLTGFFGIWTEVEKQLPFDVTYSLGDGRFTRSIRSDRELTTTQLAKVISDYVRTFDKLLKAYVAGTASPETIAGEYQAALKDRGILI